MDNEAAELKFIQSRMEYVHGVLREIGNLQDDKKGLDLTGHPELQEKLKFIKEEMGIEILADKKTFNSSQLNTLVGQFAFGHARLGNGQSSSDA